MFSRKPSDNVLQKLNCLERSSPDFPDNLTSLLSKGEDEAESYFVNTIRGTDRVWFIEYLDNVIDILDPVGPTCKTCQRILSRVCRLEEKLPRSYMLDVFSLVPAAHQTPTGPCEILSGLLLNGSKVYVKKTNPSSLSNSLYLLALDLDYVVKWKHLAHPNIISFLGITHQPIHFVSAWTPGVKLINYITNHPDTNWLDLLIGIADGLSYLHSCDVVHGDLGGPKIIVNDSGCPFIMESGLYNGPLVPSANRCDCIRWIEPHSVEMASDVFSFAMVMVEVFTGQVPFFPESDSEALSALEMGERPERPTHTGLTDNLWALMKQCWRKDRSERPKISDVLGILRDCRDDHPVLVPVLPPARTDWLTQITSEVLDLTNQVASVALFGSIGVGKTFVARTVLDHDQTKAKFGDNRYFIRCDVDSLEGFIEKVSNAIHTDLTQLEARLQSSPPLILLLDGVDSILDPLAPVVEEVHARIEEFGSYKHVCLVTTSRVYPNIHGFHRVEVPTPPEDCAQQIFYNLCNLGRSPALDILVAKLDFHPFSIEMLARSTRENCWDEEMLLKAWDDQRGVLRTSYYQGLKDTIEPVFRSPRIQELGTIARDVLEAIASFRSGIGENQLEGIFHGTGGVREVVDVLCIFSLVHRQDGVLKMLSPLQFYFLESMLVYAETEEVIRWGPDCMPAPGVLPAYGRGPPDYLLSPSSSCSTIHRPRRNWIRRLPKIIKRRLLALFGRRITPTIRVDLQEDSADTPPVALQEKLTNVPHTATQQDRPHIPPAAAQQDRSHIPPTTMRECPMNTSPATLQKDVANMPLISSQQQIPPELTEYEIGW